MDYSIEQLEVPRLGIRHYRRDYGTVVYSELEFHAIWWTLLISIKL